MAAVEEQKILETTMSDEVNQAKLRISEIQNELESVVEQLGEAKVRISPVIIWKLFFQRIMIL